MEDPAQFEIPDAFDGIGSRNKLIGSLQTIFKHEGVIVARSAASGLTASLGGRYTTPGFEGHDVSHRLYLINRMQNGRAIANMLFRTDLNQPGVWPKTSEGRDATLKVYLQPTPDELKRLDVRWAARDVAWSELLGSLAIDEALSVEASQIARDTRIHQLDAAREL